MDKPSRPLSRRRALAGGGALLAAGALAACQRPGASAAATATRTLTFWHRLPKGSGADAIASAVDEWNAQQSGVKAVAMRFDGTEAQLVEQVRTAVKSSTVPDLVHLDMADIPTMVVQGVLADAGEAAKAHASAFPEGALAGCATAGTTVGLPLTVSPLAYAYDAAGLKALGLAIPTSLAALGTEGWTAGLKAKLLSSFDPATAASRLLALTTSAGGSWFSESGGTWSAALTGSQAIAAATAVQALLDSKVSLLLDDGATGGVHADGIKGGSLLGEIIEGADVAGLLKGGTAAGSSWALTALPALGSNRPVLAGGTAACAIKGSSLTTEAMSLAAFLAGKVDALASLGLVPAASKRATTPAALKKAWGGTDVVGTLQGIAAEATMPVIAPGWSSIVTSMTALATSAETTKGALQAGLAAQQSAAIAAIRKTGAKTV